jgi:AAA domain-containing protein
MHSDGTVGRKIEEMLLKGDLVSAAKLIGNGVSAATSEDPDVSENAQGEPDQAETHAGTAPEWHFLHEEFDAEQALSKGQLITGAEMAVMGYKQEKFLIGPKLLPLGGRMLITAETGTGKSALALHTAACIITGKPLFGLVRAKKDANQGKPYFPVMSRTDVLCLDFELPESVRWEQRLSPLTNEFGNDFLKHIYFPKKPSELRLDPGEGFEKLRNLISELRPGVTIIDPLSSTHSVDENTNALKQPLNRIDQLIDQTGTTVILIHHASAKKSRNIYGEAINKSAKERPRGHTCLLDWADVHLHLETLTAKERKGYEEEDEGTETVELSLEFGKTRYCQTPRKHKIEADIGDMYFGRPRTVSPAKNNGNKGGPTTASK